MKVDIENRDGLDLQNQMYGIRVQVRRFLANRVHTFIPSYPRPAFVRRDARDRGQESNSTEHSL
jgi:hypothetical protein